MYDILGGDRRLLTFPLVCCSAYSAVRTLLTYPIAAYTQVVDEQLYGPVRFPDDVSASATMLVCAAPLFNVLTAASVLLPRAKQAFTHMMMLRSLMPEALGTTLSVGGQMLAAAVPITLQQQKRVWSDPVKAMLPFMFDPMEQAQQLMHGPMHQVKELSKAAGVTLPEFPDRRGEQKPLPKAGTAFIGPMTSEAVAPDTHAYGKGWKARGTS
jgi:hypothetical protein